EFKKFAIIQNEKVSGKDKEIAQLLKTDTNIRVLIEQECGYQNYDTQKLINKIPNLEHEEQSNSKRLEMKAEEITEYKCMPVSHNKNFNPITTNICTVKHINTKAMKTTTQNMDCSRDFSKLIITKSEIQYKKAVHTFMIWDISSEASPRRRATALVYFISQEDMEEAKKKDILLPYKALLKRNRTS
ncbi:14202_t:CDS:2, partial [Gigaspora margarita]